MFSHDCLRQSTRHNVFEVLRSTSHPLGLSGQTLGDYHNEPALKPGSVMPHKAIVLMGTIVSLLRF